MRRALGHIIPTLTVISVLVVGCDDILGSKSDKTTEEIFEAGRSEPGLLNEVEYVALFPFFTQAGDGGTLDSPQDVYVGYDELLYVVDSRGLHVLDVSGRGNQFIPIVGGGTSVIQDRRFHVYVTARRDTTVNNEVWNLPVVLHYSGITTGTPMIEDIIWHPFDDDSRKFNLRDPIPTDLEVEFTGVGVLFNNHIYVSRTGPVNRRSSVILPHNTILEFTTDGVNIQALIQLSPTRESLVSSIRPTDVMTFVHPPQRSFFNQERHFLISQEPLNEGDPDLRFPTLSIKAVVTSDGIVYSPDVGKVSIATNPERGDGFLYEPFKLKRPSDMMMAADGTNYIFVTDAAKDSLFVFTGQGVEGVAPPPGSRSSKPVVVSFGGTGNGSMQFSSPMGVGYFDRIVYVADTGNHRISRFRLNTDFE